MSEGGDPAAQNGATGTNSGRRPAARIQFTIDKRRYSLRRAVVMTRDAFAFGPARSGALSSAGVFAVGVGLFLLFGPSYFVLGLIGAVAGLLGLIVFPAGIFLLWLLLDGRFFRVGAVFTAEYRTKGFRVITPSGHESRYLYSDVDELHSRGAFAILKSRSSGKLDVFPLELLPFGNTRWLQKQQRQALEQIEAQSGQPASPEVGGMGSAPVAAGPGLGEVDESSPIRDPPPRVLKTERFTVGAQFASLRALWMLVDGYSWGSRGMKSIGATLAVVLICLGQIVLFRSSPLSLVFLCFAGIVAVAGFVVYPANTFIQYRKLDGEHFATGSVYVAQFSETVFRVRAPSGGVYKYRYSEIERVRRRGPYVFFQIRSSGRRDGLPLALLPTHNSDWLKARQRDAELLSS